jgi:hypothetical protein
MTSNKSEITELDQRGSIPPWSEPGRKREEVHDKNEVTTADGSWREMVVGGR